MQQIQCISCRQKGSFPLLHSSTNASTAALTSLGEHLSCPFSEGAKKQKNKKTKAYQTYTWTQPYIFFAPWQLFNSHSSPCKWAHSHPLPNRGEVIWTAEYKWLWMIDGPSHTPPLSRQIEIQADVCVPLAPSLHFSRSPGLAPTVCLTPTRPLNPLSPASNMGKNILIVNKLEPINSILIRVPCGPGRAGLWRHTPHWAQRLHSRPFWTSHPQGTCLWINIKVN